MNWRLGAMRWDNFASLHETWKLTAMRGYRVDLLDFDNCHLACLRDALKCQLAYYFTKMALTPCPGQSDKPSPFQERKRQRLEYRCGCLAHIKFQISNDMWEVCEFNDVHSHPMIKDNLRHFIQSGRKHTSATKNILGSMIEVGIRTKKAVRYLQNEAADNDLDCEEIARKYLYQAKIEIIKHQSELYAENYEKDKNKLSGTNPVTGCKDQDLDPIKKKNKKS
ncbi:hypothetical protein T459_27772 [Capsicum annuum]|uniref:Protein FAR1-RELATED SEQUENCE n=1 Tax=Capsicum annuum TaxID=4072 RepID=A0A2G2YEX6_CAPAN|nr:hypothetical protein T459_27772 [Capsicum annuum]